MGANFLAWARVSLPAVYFVLGRPSGGAVAVRVWLLRLGVIAVALVWFIRGGYGATHQGATMTNLLPLENWRRIIGYNPFHFWGMSNATVPVTSACNAVVKQYAWQSDNAAGRNEIIEAIETAEKRLRDYLGFPIAPEYHSETVTWPRYYRANAHRTGDIDPSGRRISLRLPDNKIRAVGVETLTYIGNAAVVLSDQDGDGLNDTFTATIATTLTDVDEIAAYFAAADRLDNESAGEKWRIRPVTATISGGFATVRGRAWLLVDPVLVEGVSTANLDPTDAATLVTTIDIYRRWTNTNGSTIATSQGVLIWETLPCHGWWCCCSGCCSSATYTPTDSSTDPAAIAQAVARVGLRDAENGRVTPGEAVRNATSGIWSELSWETCREPDRAVVRYLAGVPLQNQDVDKRYQVIVARMACAELSTRICACDTANREIYRWQYDHARTAGANDEQYAVSPEDLNNPFGTRAGQVYAWKEVSRLQKMVGFAV